mmetsp:Transcript_31062/g.63558  ORF Transcript_31062/g.63558 Transcript_31062/m.63558 type:complete len:256 (+) Transcript_31062:895-1662(+)
MTDHFLHLLPLDRIQVRLNVYSSMMTKRAMEGKANFSPFPAKFPMSPPDIPIDLCTLSPHPPFCVVPFLCVVVVVFVFPLLPRYDSHRFSSKEQNDSKREANPPSRHTIHDADSPTIYDRIPIADLSGTSEKDAMPCRRPGRTATALISERAVRFLFPSLLHRQTHRNRWNGRCDFECGSGFRDGRRWRRCLFEMDGTMEETVHSMNHRERPKMVKAMMIRHYLERFPHRRSCIPPETSIRNRTSPWMPMVPTMT